MEHQAEDTLTQRQWRSYKTSAERIFRLWNLCEGSFSIIDLLNILTPNFFERLPNKESAERWFSIVENGSQNSQNADNDEPLSKKRKIS